MRRSRRCEDRDREGGGGDVELIAMEIMTRCDEHDGEDDEKEDETNDQ